MRGSCSLYVTRRFCQSLWGHATDHDMYPGIMGKFQDTQDPVSVYESAQDNVVLDGPSGRRPDLMWWRHSRHLSPAGTVYAGMPS